MDFSENFCSFWQGEIQSTYFDNTDKYVTLFTVYIMIGSIHHNLIFVSGCLHHGTELVYHYQRRITNFILQNHPSIKCIAYVSDKRAGQFKNNKNMVNWTHHELDFGIPATWTFSATSHGKGPVDGIRATVKAPATQHTLRGDANTALLTPEAFFKFTVEFNLSAKRPTKPSWVTDEDIEKEAHNELDDRWSRCMHNEYKEFAACTSLIR